MKAANIEFQPPHRTLSTHGFSLIEILIVLALIAGITGLVVINLAGIFGPAQEDLAQTFVDNSLDPALEVYLLHMKKYPSTSEGIPALYTPPSSGSSRWRGPYLKDKEVPKDPWDNPYQYRYPGTHNTDSYDIFSLGKDGIESADDIGNWK